MTTPAAAADNPAPTPSAYMTRGQVDAAIREAIVIYHERVLERLIAPLTDAVDAHTRQLDARRAAAAAEPRV